MNKVKKRSGWPAAFMALALMLPTYVLSIGPVLHLEVRGIVSSDVVSVVYFPVDWAAERNDWLARTLNDYGNLPIWDRIAAGLFPSVPIAPSVDAVPGDDLIDTH